MKPSAKREQAAVDQWNTVYPVGTSIWYTTDEGRELPGTTRSEAQMLGGHSAVIWLEGKSACVSLSRVKLRTEPIGMNEKPSLTPQFLWGTGWLYGNNYKIRGKISESKGSEQGEPWYEAEDGMKWSSFDVRYRADPPSEAPSASAPMSAALAFFVAAAFADGFFDDDEIKERVREWLLKEAPKIRDDITVAEVMESVIGARPT